MAQLKWTVYAVDFIQGVLEFQHNDFKCKLCFKQLKCFFYYLLVCSLALCVVYDSVQIATLN